ncbi:uncharacterized protein LOC135840511 isoform X1 [Planococcus citri]|uniref:uncharacterized protein LOC135840450 isoform X1 n=1 Tax=Planococcus citri TaxID=170843 RepID=UPI0031F844E9
MLRNLRNLRESRMRVPSKKGFKKKKRFYLYKGKKKTEVCSARFYREIGKDLAKFSSVEMKPPVDSISKSYKHKSFDASTSLIDLINPNSSTISTSRVNLPRMPSCEGSSSDESEMSDASSNSTDSDENLSSDDFDAYENMQFSSSESFETDICNDFNIQENPTSSCAVQFREKLKVWAVKHRVTRSTGNDLLEIINSSVPIAECLPKDFRSILGTRSNQIDYNLETLKNGNLAYFGIQNVLNSAKDPSAFFDLCSSTIEIIINVDGLPLAKSSTVQAWPILAHVQNFEVFMVAIFISNSKPDDSNDFLKKFVTEVTQLYDNGLCVREKKYSFKLKAICADAPAKAFLMNLKGHTGFHSCVKCRVRGRTCENRTYFKDLNASKRTRDDFEKCENNPFCHTRSLLMDVPNFDPINMVPYDYMHLLCLGIMKKLIELWMQSIPRISRRVLKKTPKDILNNRLKTVANFCPVEFVRHPRSIDEYKRWKATEFRTFLLYYGTAVLIGVLPTEKLKHFQHLQFAIRLLFKNKIDRAQEIIQKFVSTFSTLYHKSLINHNLHGLIHFAEDCRVFGSPDSFSAFPFENFLSVIKKLFRSGNAPLMQIINRYSEILKVTEKKSESAKVKISHPHKLHKQMFSSSSEREIVNAYQRVHMGNFTLRCDRDGDRFCKLKDGSFIRIKDFIEVVNPITNESRICIIGEKFMEVDSLYDIPWKSDEVGIYEARNLEKNLRSYGIEKFQTKCFAFPSFNHEGAYVLAEMF